MEKYCFVLWIRLSGSFQVDGNLHKMNFEGTTQHQGWERGKRPLCFPICIPPPPPTQKNNILWNSYLFAVLKIVHIV